MTKDEILRETLLFLQENPETSIDSIHSNIKNILAKQEKYGTVTTGNQFMRTTQFVDLTNEVALNINVVIWDLIAERVLTPGVDRSNLKFPWVHVSDKEKLKQKIRSS
ncbi:hypothetical protein [Tumebacillus lipolyticus]|uniref:Uncharacterized protein n=1 Tax=Tumebacillus lipolyticus TaxID=1280370 RepID=A0ABW4ZSW3_9BACL